MEKEVLFEKRMKELSKNAYYRGVLTFSDFLDLNELHMLHSLPTVSYTHLDVYKRHLFLSMFFVILLLAGVLGIFMLKGKQAVDAPMAFKLTTEVFGQTIGEDSLVAEGVAADLCVGAGDTPLEGIETQGEERACLLYTSS